MATYYINGYNTTGEHPYTTGAGGAPNFYTLFYEMGSYLRDNDIIEVFDGEYIDDSTNDIDISVKLSITSSKDIPIHLKNDGFGFNVYMGGTTFNGIHFHKYDYVDNTMITVYSNNTTITNCDFTYDIPSGAGSVINLIGVDGTKIDNNHLAIPLGSPSAYGVYANDSSYSIITNNVIDMEGNNGQAISFLGRSHNNDVSYNIIGNFDDTTTNNVGIMFSNKGNYNNINHNAIGVSGPQSVGIVYNVDDYSGKNVKITNNFIALRENDFSSVGVLLPYQQGNHVSYFDVIDNIFDYTPTSGVGTNDSIAINASIQRGVIDYNNIHGFTLSNIFVNNGAIDVIQEVGRRTIYTDPQILWWTNPDEYEPADIRRYYCDTNSECIGSGYTHHNIGIGVYKIGSEINHYVNIVDTVTDHMGVIEDPYKPLVNTFFNNVFTESSTEFNTIYRDSNGPYPSEDVYKNQWGFVHENPVTFPFEEGDHFYKKPFYYILQHKDELSPFEGIKCPVNPGYGFSAYPGYETGLWGYPRATYKNNCFPEPCIIQDSYTTGIRIEDTINNVEFWIHDAICPECIMDSEPNCG